MMLGCYDFMSAARLRKRREILVSGKLLPPPQAQNTFSIYVCNNTAESDNQENVKALRLPDFFQKDAHIIRKLHIHPAILYWNVKGQLKR